MIVEVRTYLIKPGLRQCFLNLFETRIRPLQLSLGIGVIGPWIDLEHGDRFLWLRTFPSMTERERMKRALYEGAEWTEELEAIAMPMLAEYTSVLVVQGEDVIAGIPPAISQQQGTS